MRHFVSNRSGNSEGFLTWDRAAVYGDQVNTPKLRRVLQIVRFPKRLIELEVALKIASVN